MVIAYEKQLVSVPDELLERKIKDIGKRIFQGVRSSKLSFYDRSFWSSKLMELGMKNEKLKIELFRFVDVLPVLNSDDELTKHIQEYFGNIEGENLDFIKLAAQVGTSTFLGKLAGSFAVRTGVTQMARNFIAGENIKEVLQKINDLRKNNMTFTVDILGEAVLSEKEAEEYRKLYMDLISGLSEDARSWKTFERLDLAPYGALPKINVSVKPSSLYSQCDSMDFRNSVDNLKDKLRPVLRLAKNKNIFINLDMESYHLKDITLTVFKEILLEDEFAKWKDIGIVIQAYLKDSEADLRSLIDWVKNERNGVPITIRLVKGAYWDYETIIAKQKSWYSPVYENKFETDANFEKLIKLLLDNYPLIYPAIASHNIRSLACAVAYAELLNLPKGAIEYQFLFGMADPIKQAFVELGERVRIYTPYGKLIPGMAYLVRRLLENTSNESFLRQGFSEGISEDKLLVSPASLKEEKPEIRIQTSNQFINEPDADFTVSSSRELMTSALSLVRKNLGKKYPLIINRKRVETNIWGNSVNPAKPDEVIGQFGMAGEKEAEEAILCAKNAFLSWRDTDVSKRAEIMFHAAEIMRKQKFELAALMVFEEGKCWREADGDVSEAIDFLNYYSICALKLFSPERLMSPPGEENISFYQPRGVCVVISPWNFPLAILCGMSSAALISGNTVILKPAKQASIIASKYMEILEEAGLPAGVCNYLPGDGKSIGNYLVSHKDISLIAFTGSMEVGLSINKLASNVTLGQTSVKKVICEMGGKNAVIVDNDADLDEAIKGVVYSAFGYSGQKCSAASRVIVLKEIYDSFIQRLQEAAKSIKVGMPEDPSSYLGPVIDKGAYDNTKKYIEIGKKEGKIICGNEVVPPDGYFISPTIFTDVLPSAKIAQEEIFAPVLTVIKVNTFDEAIDTANDVMFALTGGLFSRSPENIKKAKEKFRVGNLYINRGCTGAKVGRQPFGGFKMSGIGSKAGGKDYLLQFVEPRVVTENTMRRGFAPEA